MTLKCCSVENLWPITSSNLTNPQQSLLRLKCRSTRRSCEPLLWVLISFSLWKNQRQGHNLIWWSLWDVFEAPFLLKETQYFINKATPIKNVCILLDARLLVENAWRPSLENQSLCTFITTQNLCALDCRISCASFHSDILLFKKKKDPPFEMSLAVANRELLLGSLPEAVLFRFGCPRQLIKRNLENKALLLCWVTFDSLKRSRTSLLSRVSRWLC